MRLGVRSISLLLLLLVCTTASAQDLGVLSGHVTEADSGEPLAGVHVFLANTTLGTTTDIEGYYELRHVPTGPFQLVASMVGFETATASLVFEAGAEPLRHNFAMRESVTEMAGIEVSGERPRGWNKRVQEFETELLGDSPNGRAAGIANPHVLDFDDDDGVLVAKASEPLIIENPRLGYRLHFVLTKFRLERGQRRKVTFEGMPRFEELPAGTAENAKARQKYREAAYRGSLQHLLWSIIHDRASEERFNIQQDDLPGGPLSDEIPEYQSVRIADLAGPTELPGVYQVRFDGYLNIIYHEPGEFSLAFWRPSEPDRQISWMTTNNLSGYIHEDGTSYPSSPLVVSGYMTQLRLADYVPRDFARRLQWEEMKSADKPEPVVDLETGFPQDPARVHPSTSYGMQTVVRAIKESNWETALDLLNSRVRARPNDLEARYYRGIVHREVAKYGTLTQFDHWREGRDDFDFILAQDSTYRDALYQLALYSRVQTSKIGLRERNISYRDAIDLGHALVRLKPDKAVHRFDLITLYRRYIGNTGADEAAEWLRGHDSDFARFFLGEVYRLNGRVADADRIYAELLDDSSEVPRQAVLLARARLAYEGGSPAEGQSFVRQAIASITSPVDAAHIFEDVKYIIDEKELATYRALEEPSEFEAFFEALWTRRNPLPSFDVDVRMAEHYRRLVHAEREYAFDGYRIWSNNPDKSNILDPPPTYALNTALDDRGLVYVRLGEPSTRVKTHGGDACGFESSLATDGEPIEQASKACLQPNESWRYSDLGLDFHFVVDEGAAPDDWRLAPYVTKAREAVADSSRAFVRRGLNLDRHTWGSDVEPLSFPFVAAAFRGRGGLTDYEISYAVPTGRALESVESDSVTIEVGVAVHDTMWSERLKKGRFQRVPRPTDPYAIFLQSMRLSLPPDSYRVALSARLPETPLVGGYTFDRRLPDFTGADLAMSDILRAQSIAVVSDGEPDARSDFRIVPSLHRTIYVTNPLFVYFEVYNLTFNEDERSNYAIEYTLRRQRKGIFRPSDIALRMEADYSSAERWSFEHAELDVSAVPPGSYLLDVTVRDLTRGQSVSRSEQLELMAVPRAAQ